MVSVSAVSDTHFTSLLQLESVWHSFSIREWGSEEGGGQCRGAGNILFLKSFLFLFGEENLIFIPPWIPSVHRMKISAMKCMFRDTWLWSRERNCAGLLGDREKAAGNLRGAPKQILCTNSQNQKQNLFYFSFVISCGTNLQNGLGEEAVSSNEMLCSIYWSCLWNNQKMRMTCCRLSLSCLRHILFCACTAYMLYTKLYMQCWSATLWNFISDVSWGMLFFQSRYGSRLSGSGGMMCTSGEESSMEWSGTQLETDEQPSSEEWLVRSKATHMKSQIPPDKYWILEYLILVV